MTRTSYSEAQSICENMCSSGLAIFIDYRKGINAQEFYGDGYSVYKLKRCSNKECCKQCRYVRFKGTMTKYMVVVYWCTHITCKYILGVQRPDLNTAGCVRMLLYSDIWMVINAFWMPRLQAKMLRL